MSKLDLRKIKTVFICPDHDERYKERCNYMFDLLKRLGFEKVVHYKSTSMRNSDNLYPLNLSTYNILQMSLDEPVLILEDDLEFVENANFIIEVPEKADAIYLGLSKCNFNFETDTNEFSAKFENFDENYARILNMLSTHAILYLSKEYKSKISEVLKYANDTNDVEICKYQSEFNLYGLKSPICWQSHKFNQYTSNHTMFVESVTKIKIDDNLKSINF